MELHGISELHKLRIAFDGLGPHLELVQVDFLPVRSEVDEYGFFIRVGMVWQSPIIHLDGITTKTMLDTRAFRTTFIPVLAMGGSAWRRRA